MTDNPSSILGKSEVLPLGLKQHQSEAASFHDYWKRAGTKQYLKFKLF